MRFPTCAWTCIHPQLRVYRCCGGAPWAAPTPRSSTEVLINELAVAAGADPVEFRRTLLKDHPRHLAVLDLAAEKAGWGKPLPAGWGRGVAVHESFNSYVAEVAEVQRRRTASQGRAAWCAPWTAASPSTPDMVTAQMEGGIGFGLAAALYGAVTLKDGRACSRNFDDFRILRMKEMPRVEVHIVRQQEPRPPASASRACRRSPRRWPTPCSPPPASRLAQAAPGRPRWSDARPHADR